MKDDALKWLFSEDGSEAMSREEAERITRAVLQSAGIVDESAVQEIVNAAELKSQQVTNEEIEDER